MALRSAENDDKYIKVCSASVEGTLRRVGLHRAPIYICRRVAHCSKVTVPNLQVILKLQL